MCVKCVPLILCVCVSVCFRSVPKERYVPERPRHVPVWRRKVFATWTRNNSSWPLGGSTSSSFSVYCSASCCHTSFRSLQPLQYIEEETTCLALCLQPAAKTPKNTHPWRTLSKLNPTLFGGGWQQGSVYLSMLKWDVAFIPRKHLTKNEN